MSAEIIKLLRKTPIFSTLDSSSLKKVIGFFKGKTFAAEEVLYKEGTLGDTLYIIQDGAIKITRAAREGEEETSRSLRREGDIFGESGFIDESPRPNTAQAIKPTKVLELCRSDFLTILNNDPLIAYQIVKVLSSRLKQSDLRQIEELKEKNERLQQTYNELQKQLGTTGSKASSDELSSVPPEEQNLSKQALYGLPYPIILASREGRVSFLNRAAERQLGYKGQEILGKPVARLWDETSWMPLSQTVEEQLEAGSSWEGQIVAKKSDGERFAYHAVIMEVCDDKGESVGRLYLGNRARQSPSSEMVKESLDLKDFFDEELHVLRTHEKFRDITFATNFEDNTPRVKANKRQLQQLLCAMMDNCAWALQTVSDRVKTITVEVCGINDRRDVQIMISDNGVGISPENLSKVFKEPFTTKPDGSGSGLLAVDKIVKDHGGSVEIHSDEGAYTLFIMKLPTCEQRTTSAPQTEPAFKSHA